MTTPLLRQARNALPHAQIDYLVGQGCAGILEGNPAISRVVRFDESILYQRKFARLGSLVRLLHGYDAVFVLDKHWIFALVARLAGVPMRVGFARRGLDGMFLTRKIAYGEVKHEVAYYLALWEAVGMPIDHGDVAMDLPSSSERSIEGPYLVLINGGGANANEQSTVRRMPDSLFSELVRVCLAQGKVVFLGGRDEAGYYEKFAATGTVNLCGRTGLREAADVLRHAQAVYSTDTGLMHMAGAVNARLTAIFGPTHPARKCPPGARWAWTDQDIYDDRYELYGKVPHRKFFQKMSVENILYATHGVDISLSTSKKTSYVVAP